MPDQHPLPDDVWVVFHNLAATMCPHFVASHRHIAMDRATELAGNEDAAEFMPVKTARYVAERFAPKPDQVIVPRWILTVLDEIVETRRLSPDHRQKLTDFVYSVER